MKKIMLCIAFNVVIISLHAQKLSVLKDIRPGIKSSYPDYLIRVDNKLFFSAEDSLHGNELWIAEGSQSTTHLLLDLNPGKAGSFPQNLIYMNGAIYFNASNGISGQQLWKLNLENMTAVKLTNTTASFPFWLEDGFIVYKNNLYFSFDEGVHGSEVWKTNGTVAGTVLVKDLWPGQLSTNPREFFIFRNKLFFLGEDDIDTKALYVINSITKTCKRFFNCGEEGCSAVTIYNDALYFFSDDQIFSSPDVELYTSNGTAAATHIVKQINPTGFGAYFGKIVVAGKKMFFAADDGVHGIELWRSDGTGSGTKMIKNIASGSQSCVPTDLIAYNSKVIFQAYQQPGNGATWLSDGTTAGTIKLADMLVYSTGKNFIKTNNGLLFVAYVNGFGYELCTTDGTTVGTKLFRDINKGLAASYPDRFTARDSTLFFIATDDIKGTEVFLLTPVEFMIPFGEVIAANLKHNMPLSLHSN